MKHRRITAKHAIAGDAEVGGVDAVWETSGFNDACNSSAEGFSA